ncbi:Uncharacterised protein [Mycobacteroides abscessus subsp. abscessus]|nr:Uncharacterised protein [Mycobacteroides abscessus subsp. abscessus]
MKEDSEYWPDLLDKEIDSIERAIGDEANNTNKKDGKDENNGNSINNSKNTSKNENEKNRSNVLDSMRVGKKEYKKYYKGVYLDEDIYKVITTLVKKKGGGRQNILSKIINDCVRESFEKRGLL